MNKFKFFLATIVLSGLVFSISAFGMQTRSQGNDVDFGPGALEFIEKNKKKNKKQTIDNDGNNTVPNNDDDLVVPVIPGDQNFDNPGQQEPLPVSVTNPEVSLLRVARDTAVLSVTGAILAGACLNPATGIIATGILLSAQGYGMYSRIVKPIHQLISKKSALNGSN